MKLVTKEVKDSLPELYSQEGVDDPLVRVKFFTPWTDWTWYAIEFDGDDTFFGYVDGIVPELGYFSLSELESVQGPGGLKVERDKFYKPERLSEVKKRVEK